MSEKDKENRDLVDREKTGVTISQLGISSIIDEELLSVLRQWEVPSVPRSCKRKVMSAYRTRMGRNPFWKRVLTFSIPVPLPISAAAVVIICVLALNAVRTSQVAMREQSSLRPTRENVKTIDVPVFRERVTTRTVYVKKENPKSSRNKTHTSESTRDGFTLAMNGPGNEPGYVTRANLTGFQPIEEPNIRVIRKRGSDEK